jgi:hypothetical protein
MYETSLYIDPPVPLKAQPIAVSTAQRAVCCVISIIDFCEFYLEMSFLL